VDHLVLATAVVDGLVAVLLSHRRDSRFDLAPWRRRFHGVAASVLRDARPALAS
jgi:hypothetical protein